MKEYSFSHAVGNKTHNGKVCIDPHSTVFSIFTAVRNAVAVIEGNDGAALPKQCETDTLYEFFTGSDMTRIEVVRYFHSQDRIELDVRDFWSGIIEHIVIDIK